MANSVLSIFSFNDLSKELSNEPYTYSQKEEVLEKLNNLQFTLENYLMDEDEELKYVDDVIFFINDLDKSLSTPVKNKLNNIIYKLKTTKK
jgi:hypothetical protein